MKIKIPEYADQCDVRIQGFLQSCIRKKLPAAGTDIIGQYHNHNESGLCVLVVFAGLLSHQADQCHDCDAKAVDQHVRKPSCAARDEELMEFVGAGVEEDDGESGEKAAFHVGGPIRKVQSKTDGAVKYQIFSHMSGFSDGEAHKFDEVGVLRRISVEKALCRVKELSGLRCRSSPWTPPPAGRRTRRWRLRRRSLGARKAALRQ